MLYRYFIKVSFDGTNYNGWQVQKNSAHTIQQKINEGLSKLLSEEIKVFGCCRTDTGVHAKELYAHFDSKRNDLSPRPKGRRRLKGVDAGFIPVSKLNTLSPFRDGAWLHKFNSMLPIDISIDEMFSVNENANARFDATARTYQYFIHSKRNPFLVNRSYYYYSELDVTLMNKAAKILKKCEDFSAFSKVHTQVKTNICRIYNAEWMPPHPPKGGFARPSSPPLGELEGALVFTIRADRFLRGMVRMIVGTMMLVGKHKITLDDFKKIIESKDCRNAGALVPACGLYLTKVDYPKKIFKI